MNKKQADLSPAPSKFHRHDADCWKEPPQEKMMAGYGKTWVVRCAVLFDRAQSDRSLFVAKDVGYVVDEPA